MKEETSQTVFRLPRSHWHCTITNFAWDTVRPLALHNSYLQFLQEAAEGGSPHLLLTGPPGIGKSHLSIAAYRWMVMTVGTELATWINVPAFCDKIKNAYNIDSYDPMAEYQDARRFVVLDDLFGREHTPHEGAQIIPRLLDIAYQNNAAVLLTMNQDVKDLPARLHEHEVSRLLAEAKIIPMTAEQDWRRK